MNEDVFQGHMDAIIDMSKDALVDSFAELIKSINERTYDEAAIRAHAISYALGLLSQGLATEALARRQNQGLDKPE